MRETILSELVDAEFPHGAVPTLAIIDTGTKQVWEQCHPPKVERRCILVRSCFLRPAHFERAAGFLAHDDRGGYLDRLRVAHMFRTAMELFGRETILSTYRAFWLKWAEQLAYAFIHRLPHCGDNTSNIALDGKLLDFGAMTAVPSWARISAMLSAPPVGENVATLIEAITVHARHLAHHVDPNVGTPARIRATVSQAVQHYQLAVLREMLRVSGLTRRQAESLLASKDRAELVSILGRLLNRFRREQFAIFDGTPEPRIPWDIDRLWSESPPEHLRSLQEFLIRNLDLYRGMEPKDQLLRALVRRCTMRTLTRSELYRERIKKDLFRILENDLAGDALNQQSLDQLISATVCRNRRDSKVELDGAICIGFARNACVGYALFRCLDTAEEFAIKEWDSSGETQCDRDAQSISGGNPERLYIAEIHSGGILFASSAAPEFSGAVWLMPVPEYSKTEGTEFTVKGNVSRPF